MMQILPVHTPPEYDPLRLLKPLAAALAGEGPAVAPYGTDQPPAGLAELTREDAARAAGNGVSGSGMAASGRTGNGAGGSTGTGSTEDIAVVVSTSGSTGAPKQTMLSIGALAASSMATAVRLRGEGQWLLALPVHYVAGLQVLVRSLYAGTRPEVLDLSAGFDPGAFTSAAREMTDHHRYVSLVPTQLHRLLESPDPSTMGVLRRFNAILLGGGPARPDLLSDAAGEGLKVVTTYGMSETCGGCVYNGRPLDGVQVRLENGRIWLGGDVVASGYLHQPERMAESFSTTEGTRWYRTEDLGEMHDGVLQVQGRVDDVILTGGMKISASSVRDVLEDVEGITAAFVGGVADHEWGMVVGAVVAADQPITAAAADAVKSAVRSALGPAAVPKVLLGLDRLPVLSTGKPDRQQLLELLQRRADERE